VREELEREKEKNQLLASELNQFKLKKKQTLKLAQAFSFKDSHLSVQS